MTDPRILEFQRAVRDLQREGKRLWSIAADSYERGMAVGLDTALEILRARIARLRKEGK